mmetsp:Transcript_30431/g.69432  ORF Transcript_30431/g.69432 Transcript_30431/m.69432 type:complete len:167 (+) Transcript_30431:3808-4308(+)
MSGVDREYVFQRRSRGARPVVHGQNGQQTVLAKVRLKLPTIVESESNTKIRYTTRTTDRLEKALRTEEADIGVGYMKGLDLKGTGNAMTIQDRPLDQTTPGNLVLAGEILDFHTALRVSDEVTAVRCKTDGGTCVHDERITVESTSEAARRKGPKKDMTEITANGG